MTTIIRKPKFMRNDECMKIFIDVAYEYSKLLDDPKCTIEDQVRILKKIGQCINNAAKAGGFFRTKDFLNWIKNNKDKYLEGKLAL